jgi:ketosteroid isomerase-like protein
MADPLELLEAALTAWQAADVDRWLEAFSPDATFFVPGRTSVSGDHTVESIREVAPRLMRAHGDESGMWLIESYGSPNGAVALADQTVLREGVIHHYHQMLLHELRPGVSDRFAHFWVMVHEYDAFESAWS